MPNDAKLGLVIGVGLVLALGVVYYRKDSPQAPSGQQSAASDSASIQSGAPPGRGLTRGKARPVSQQHDGPLDEPPPVPDPMNSASPE